MNRIAEWLLLWPLWRRVFKEPGTRTLAATLTPMAYVLVIIIAAATSGGGSSGDRDHISTVAGTKAPMATRTASPSPAVSVTPSPEPSPIPSPTPSAATTPAAPTAAPTAPPTPVPTAPPPTQPPAVGVSITSITSPVYRGSNATLVAQTSPATNCTIRYTTPAGNPSKAAGLTPKTADANGSVSWTWKIDANTTPGTGTVTVTCNGQSASVNIVIV